MDRTLSPVTNIGILTAGVLSAALLGCSAGYEPTMVDYNGAGPITVTEEPPPAVSGGTLLVTRDGVAAVAADPDRDGVWVAPLDGGTPSFLKVERYDEPGRVVEDGAGRAHVALRRGGALVTIDIASRKIVDRRPVCPAPRGLAYDAARDAVQVACAGGELVTLPAAGGEATRRLRLDADLRDIVVEGDRLLVSRFRSAETLVVSAEGQVLSRRQLPPFHADGGAGSEYQANVAWRMTSLPGGGAAMVHQRAMTSPVVLAPGGYYANAGCTGTIVHSAISVIPRAGDADDGGAPPAFAAIPSVALPVDIAVSPTGTRVAIVSASNNVVLQEETSILQSESGSGNCFPSISSQETGGQPTAVAYAPDGRLVVQTREPAALLVLNGRTISLPGDSVRDTGHEMFHRSPNSFSPIACASCHPEGHEDGHTWNFDPTGPRRTQAIGGGVLQTAPLHWAGDLSDLSSLMTEVFVGRMSGPAPGLRRVQLMGRFIDNLPAFPASPPDDVAAVSRGEALFTDAKVGCASCHSGSRLTSNENKDIGRGVALQVPSLVGIAGRAPYMHDGCAATLRDRFDPACGGDKHGDVAGLSAAQLDDLVAYLTTL
jgi:mono/diheme cytochrome c family protein/DNA-binding beta-propeller fold protein YncE